MQAFLDSLRPHWTPHSGQAEYLLSAARIKVLACGRRWGKTDACAVELAQGLCGEEPVNHLILAPTLDQARLLFDRVCELLRLLGHSIKPVQTPHPRLSLGPHRLQARSGHLGHALRGHEATHIIVDEAAYVPESLVTEVAMPMLATTSGKLTLISTPRGHNHFRKFYAMGERGEHGVWSRRSPSRENPLVSPSYLELQRELIPDRAFRVEYEAEFLDGAGRVFKTDQIDACLVPRFLQVYDGPLFVGIDWARYTDYTAVAVVGGNRDGARLIRLEKWTGLSWHEQVSRVAEMLGQLTGARVLCDATGVGDPVLEMLQRRVPSHRVEGFSFTGPSKAELLEGLVWMFERAALQMLPHPDLLRELQHFEAEITPTGHARMNAAPGYHDDLVIALALAVRQLPRPYRATLTAIGTRPFHTNAQNLQPTKTL